MEKMSKEQAISLGYSADIRKRRRQHRAAAKKLLNGGGVLNGFSAPGSNFWMVAQWHLQQARAL